MSIKRQKGITLMVLVITIVVMLIIAGASASMLFDGEGLLKTSEESKRLQENYANGEETKTNDLINDVTNIMSEANGKPEDEKPTQQEPEQKEYVFDYTGAVQEWTVPTSGVWKLEVWGAQGGDSLLSSLTGNPKGGYGGYSKGTLTLDEASILYIYIGGQPTTADGGFNGGGNSAYASRDCSGGGASDVRVQIDDLYARVIVSGGGGGPATSANGGAGGGKSGINGPTGNGNSNFAGGGTQISGGALGTGGGGTGETAGKFGIGGNGSGNSGGAGGGGWYGGGGGGFYAAGGGGSGWIYTADTFNTWKTGNPTDAANWKLDSKYYLTDAQTIDGATSMPTHDGTGTMTGNSGNGYAKITWVGFAK